MRVHPAWFACTHREIERAITRHKLMAQSYLILRAFASMALLASCLPLTFAVPLHLSQLHLHLHTVVSPLLRSQQGELESRPKRCRVRHERVVRLAQFSSFLDRLLRLTLQLVDHLACNKACQPRVHLVSSGPHASTFSSSKVSAMYRHMIYTSVHLFKLTGVGGRVGCLVLLLERLHARHTPQHGIDSCFKVMQISSHKYTLKVCMLACSRAYACTSSVSVSMRACRVA